MMTTGDMCIVKKLFVMFGYVIFDICEWTDRQTYRYADCNTSPPSWGEVIVI